MRPLPRRLLAIGIALALCGGACAKVLGIEELGVRAAAVTPPGPVDAGPDGCVVSDASFCTSVCPRHDFCDDFEGATAAFANWNGGAALAGSVGFGSPNRIVDNVENIIEPRVDSIDGVNGTSVLFASVLAKDNTASVAFLGHELKAPVGKVPRGIDIRLVMRVRDVSFAALRPGDTAQYVYTLGIGDPASNEGIALLLRPKNVEGELNLVFQQRSILTEDVTIDLGRVYDLDPGFRLNWFVVELAIGTEALFKERGVPCALTDDDGNPVTYREIPGAKPEGLRLFVKLAGIFARCLALRNEFGNGAWLTRPNFVAGLAIGDKGSAEVRSDNLAVDFVY